MPRRTKALDAARQSILGVLQAKVDDFVARANKARNGVSRMPTKVRANNTSMPYRKATKAEMVERIGFVRTLIARQFSRIEIHHEFRKKNIEAQKTIPKTDKRHWFYRLDWRTIDMYMRYARNELLQAAGKTKADVLAESVGYWEDRIRNAPTEELRDNARRQLDDILAVHQPKTNYLTTPRGQPIELRDVTARPLKDYSTADLRQIADEILDVEVITTNGHNGNNGNGKH